MAQLGRAGWPATEQARGPGGADSLHATGAGGRDGTPASRARDGGPTSRPLTCRRGERYAACRGGRYSLLRRATRTVVAHFCCAASRRARRRSLSAVLMPCEQAREASPPGLEGGVELPASSWYTTISTASAAYARVVGRMAPHALYTCTNVHRDSGVSLMHRCPHCGSSLGVDTS